MALVKISTALLVLAGLAGAQPQGTIDGRVTNSVSGEGVPGVRARFLNKGYVYEASTDASGAYHLTGLADGDYAPEFMKDGYSQSTRGHVQVAGSVPATFNLQMRPWGSLRGRVLDEDAKPVAGVRVEIGRGIRDDISTNAAGEFAFEEVAPGSYILVAKPPPNVRVQDGVRLGTIAIYYPSGTEPSQAVPITVRAGEDVSNIEVRLKSVPVHRISGVILDPGGKPVPNAAVRLVGRAGLARQASSLTVIMPVRPANSNGPIQLPTGFELGSLGIITTVTPGPAPIISQVQSRQDGTFEFAAVEAGEWRISADTGLYQGMPLGNVVSAFVGEKDVEDLQIRLSEAFPTRATASIEGSNSSDALISAPDLQPVDAQEHVYYGDPQKGKRPGLLPGRYRVLRNSAFQAQDRYVASILWQGRDVMGQVVELGPGADPFQMVYKTGLGSVRGTIENGAGALVLLIPRGLSDVIEVRSIQCNADGAFSLGNVPPGDYGIVAFDHGVLAQVSWNSLESLVVPLETSVHIDAGGAADVNPRLSSWPW